jgi:hypothetical protein
MEEEFCKYWVSTVVESPSEANTFGNDSDYGQYTLLTSVEIAIQYGFRYIYKFDKIFWENPWYRERP